MSQIEELHQPDTQPIAEVPFEYKQLTGHYRTDGSYKSDEELRTEYLRNTDELIRQMTEGVLYKDPQTGEESVSRPDAVVWLDKSARPVSWLTKETWPMFAADAEGNIPKMPAFYFANIDREQWVNTIDPEGNGMVDVDKVDPSVIRSLRSIYVSPSHKKDGLTEEIDSAQSELDGKHILIVDEVFASGRTLTYATKFFQKAFPTAKVAGTYWMGGVAQVGIAQGNADLPVWYKNKIYTGRGVGNRDEKASLKSPSLTQRLGGWFLSTAFEHPDPASVQLRKELKHLAHDHDVLVEPSRFRPEEEQDERIMRFNGLEPTTFYAKRKAQITKK